MKTSITCMAMSIIMALAASASAANFSFSDVWNSNGVVPSGGYHGIELGDLDGDGDLDIATDVNSGGERAIVLRNTTGTSFEVALNTVRGDWGEPAFVDLGNDGDLDFVGTHLNGHGYLNNAGTFSTSRIDNLAPLGGYRMDHLTIVDYNGDGLMDWVQQGGGGVELYANNGSGAFPSISESVNPGWSYDAEFGDFNGDAYLDMAVAVAGNPFKIYTQNSSGVFADTGVTLNYTGAQATANKLEWADFDGDGDDDLALGNGTTVELFRNNGTSLDWVQTLASTGGHGDPEWADLDGDGDPDLVVSGTGGNGLSTYINDGGTLALDWVSTLAMGRVVLGDVNGDGDIDIVGINGGDSIHLWENSTPQVPEPSSFALAALGMAGLGWFGWRRRRQA